MLRFLMHSIPYCIVLLFAIAQFRMQRLLGVVVENGARRPNPATGETWEIVFKGGAFRYVTFEDYFTYQAPFYMAPIFFVSILFIIWHMRQAVLPEGKAGDRSAGT